MTNHKFIDLFNHEYLRTYIREISPGNRLLEIENNDAFFNGFVLTAKNNLCKQDCFCDIARVPDGYAKFIASIVLNILKMSTYDFVIVEKTADYAALIATHLYNNNVKHKLVDTEDLTLYRASVVVLTSPDAYSVQDAGRNKSSVIIETHPSAIHPDMDRLLADLDYSVIPDLWCLFGYMADNGYLQSNLKYLFDVHRLSRKSSRSNLRWKVITQCLGLNHQS